MSLGFLLSLPSPGLLPVAGAAMATTPPPSPPPPDMTPIKLHLDPCLRDPYLGLKCLVIDKPYHFLFIHGKRAGGSHTGSPPLRPHRGAADGPPYVRSVLGLTTGCLRCPVLCDPK